MVQYLPFVNYGHPGSKFIDMEPCSTRDEAIEIIETWLEARYPNDWKRHSRDQWIKKNSNSLYILAGIGEEYTDEEAERREMKRLPARIRKLTIRLEELRDKYPRGVRRSKGVNKP